MPSGGDPKHIGSALAADLALAARECTRATPCGLTEPVVVALADRFSAVPGKLGRAARDGRGDHDYWWDHGVSTGALMRSMAERWGGDPVLYDLVGRVHDLDYLMFPHDAPGPGSKHPVPLVLAMRDAHVHPAVCLAVLEHAPYLGFRDQPTSRLSATLSAAEDLTTVAALDPPFSSATELSTLARELLSTVRVSRVIHRKDRVRVESNPGRFIDAPLRLVVCGGPFVFDL